MARPIAFSRLPFTAAETARLNELRLIAAELHVAAGLRLGDPAAMVPEAERLTRDEPLREVGRRLHALALWSSTRWRLSAAPAASSPRNSGSTPARTSRRWKRRSSPSAPTSCAIVPRHRRRTAPPPEPVPFVGRDAQHSALVAAAAQAVTDGVRVALVIGEARLGKSTLLEHLGRRLEREG